MRPTLGVSAALLVVVGGGVLSALDADGTLGSPAAAPGGVAGAVDGLLSAGALVTGAAGVSTFVSFVHAAIELPSATALTVMRKVRVDIVCSGHGGKGGGRVLRQRVKHDAVVKAARLEPGD